MGRGICKIQRGKEKEREDLYEWSFSMHSGLTYQDSLVAQINQKRNTEALCAGNRYHIIGNS